jgi:HSP20 family protein
MALFLEPFSLFELTRGIDRMLAPSGTAFRSFAPAADVVVTKDHVTVTMDVPGLKVEDLSIELEDDVLTVRGERTLTNTTGNDDNGRSWQRLERGFGKFERVLRVPKGLDPDAVRACMADGVLTLHIPMPETHKPRRIEIQTGDAQPTLDTASSATDQERELAGNVA